MSEILKIFLTSGLTLIGGVILFSITKLFEKLYVERLLNYNRILNEIDQTLLFYTPKITKLLEWDSAEERISVSDKLRKLSAELASLQLKKNSSWKLKKLTFSPAVDIFEAFKPLTKLAVDIHLNSSISREEFNKILDEIDYSLKPRI